MTVFMATLVPMLTLFLCIAIGYVLTKTKVLPEASSKAFAKAETWIFCPALSFMTNMRYCTMDTIAYHGQNVMFGAIATVFSIAVAILLSKLFAKDDKAERGIYSYALAIANMGYMGDPIILTLFGEEVLSYYKFFTLPFSLAIYTWGISVLTPDGVAKGNPIKKILNAPTIALFAGALFGLTGWGNYLPEFFTSALDSLKACMGPVAMLLAGITIAKYDLLTMIKNKKVYVATALRLVVIPAAVIAVLVGAKALISAAFNISIGNEMLFLALFATATPLGLNTIVFPEAYGGDPSTGASMAMISHTLCVVTIPLMYALMIFLFGTPVAA